MEPQQIREGYLVKKRTVLNYWTAMWVVLSEDGLEFYKKKTDQSPKGMIPLKGATLISPCQECGTRMLVFKLTTHTKQDHFFQASHVEERELWVKDIRSAIRCLQGGKKFARKSTRRSIRLPDTVNLNALYTQLRDQDEGVKELKLEQDNRIFNHCFTGCTVVDWLISKEKARNRPEALMLATGLLNEGFLQPAGELSKDGAVSGEKSLFLDQTEAFYYFADSGFFCEGYSSDEETLVKEEFRGNIVKQGCLLKQGHKRKNWKVRKFILRNDPAFMHYYDPTKGDEPLGSIHLRGSVVTAVDFVPDAKRYDVDGDLFEIITSDETHYFLQAATAKERKEWIEALQEVSKSGK
ncbi:pleckstrin [Corythoichthys intestinalis]|uniref:pleckstrin n=1 Tax=Corythoichthys intestinalis TaxID=161448 RepID=UPI0025A5F273|nr:pleckstrin [Corythoichthys intestinalis]